MRWRLIAAIAGVLAVAVVTSSSGATAATGVERSAAELVAYVPSDHRYACDIADASPEDVGKILAAAAASIEAVVECGGGTQDVDYVAYVQFTDLDAMNAAYRGFVGNAADQAPRSGDGECPGEHTWNFDGDTVGSVGCFYSTEDGLGATIPERAALVWTYDDALIMGLANTEAANADALSSWWDDEAGPLEEPDDVDGLAATPGTASRSAERRLRSHVPAAIRSSCQSLDPGDPDSIGASYYRSRLWIEAVVACEPRRGADSEYFYAIDPAALDGFFEPFVGRIDEEGDPCPAEGTWTLGKGSKKREVGEYVCFTDSELDAARMVWSQRELGIMASAVRDDGDFDALYDFWSSGAGPQ